MNEIACLGVDGIDRLLEGGVHYGSQIMVEGDSGVGKTVLAAQFLAEGLYCGDTCIYVACDELPAIIRRHLLSFRVDPQPYEAAGRLVLVDAFAPEEGTERVSFPGDLTPDKFYALEQEFLNRVDTPQVRMVVDSLSTVLLDVPLAEAMDFHRQRLKSLRRRQVLSMDLFVCDLLLSRVSLALNQLYNAIIRMRLGGSAAHPVRMLQVGKLKSSSFNTAQHQFTIHPRFGIIITGGMGESHD